MKQKICAILILAMVLVMAMAFPTAAEVPFSFPEGTVHYGFDNQTVNDSGKNGFHGTLNGEGVTYVDGLNGGYALQMDANSYANIPVDATNLEDSMTYILWFKTETLNPAWNRIIATGLFGANPAPGMVLGIFRADGADYVVSGIGADDANYQSFNLMGAPEGAEPYHFSDNQWYCIGLTVKDGAAVTYLNGVAISEYTYDAEQCSVYTYEETTCIGGYLYFDTLYESFTGTVDEVYYIPGALSADDMKAYYDAESNGQIAHEKADPPATSETPDSSSEEETTAPTDTTAKDTEDTQDDTTDAKNDTTADTTTADTTTADTKDDAPQDDAKASPILPIVIAVVVAVVIVVAVIVVIKKKKA